MTNRQQTTLNMSMVPLVIILVLIAGAGYMLLRGEIDLSKWTRGFQLRRMEGFPTVIYVDTEIEKQRLVIRTEEELSKFLNLVDTTGLTILRDPVDFNKEMLIAASTESEKETGHSLKIKKIYEKKDSKTLVVSVLETEKGDNCVLENDPNVSVDMVAISKTDWTIEFERVKRVDSCEPEDNTQQTSEDEV